jgi:mannose-1-phosphate guanylyltransferase
MLPVVEVPMIERVLAHLASHGIDQAVLSLGYRPDAFADAYPGGRCAGVAVTYATEPTPLDTAGGIRFAAREAGIDDTFLVVNGDVLADIDLTALIAFHRDRGAEGTISLTPVEDPSSFGVVPTDADGRVVAFIEKPSRDDAPTNMINAGFYVLEPSVLDRIAGEGKVNIERETFPAMVADRCLFALGSNAYWHDVGTPERYLEAHAGLLSGERPGPPAPGAVEIASGVWHLGAPQCDGSVRGRSLLGDGAVVASQATVTDSVIGRNAEVAKGARVTGSVLLAGARVDAGAVVEASVVGPGVTVGAGATVRDLSVLGRGALVEEGETVAGVRLPEGPG